MPSLRVVLDTNVWLDWLVFDDPSVEAIREAQRLAEVDIVIDDGCTAELQRVLAYPALALDDARQRDCLDRLRACTSRHDGHLAPGCTALPRWDKALLSVSRSRLAQAGFRVGTPLEFALSRCPGKAASG
jgi:predicted nucleic acid-binding protein